MARDQYIGGVVGWSLRIQKFMADLGDVGDYVHSMREAGQDITRILEAQSEKFMQRIRSAPPASSLASLDSTPPREHVVSESTPLGGRSPAPLRGLAAEEPTGLPKLPPPAWAAGTGQVAGTEQEAGTEQVADNQQGEGSAVAGIEAALMQARRQHRIAKRPAAKGPIERPVKSAKVKTTTAASKSEPPSSKHNHTTYYKGLKVNVCAKQKAYRVFLDPNSRCDWSVKWHGDTKAAWGKVVTRIDSLP